MITFPKNFTLKNPSEQVECSFDNTIKNFSFKFQKKIEVLDFFKKIGENVSLDT